MMQRLWLALGILLLSCGGTSDTSVLGVCHVDGECPLHQYCAASTSSCVSGCLSNVDCDFTTCDSHGRCLDMFTPSGGDGPDAGLASQPDLGPPVVVDLAGADLTGVDLASAPPDLSPPPDLFTPVDAGPCAGACPDLLREPNNVYTQATPTVDNITLTELAICPASDVDWFKVIGSRKGKLDVYLTNGPCGAPLRIDIFASDGTTMMGISASTGPGWHANAAIQLGETQYIRVQPISAPGQNRYTLQLTNG